MNCRPGDLAMITNQVNYGRLVEVLSWRGHSAIDPAADFWDVKLLQSAVGESYFGAVRTHPAGAEVICRDAHLKPFRPPGLEDETETIKGLETT